MNPKNNPFDEDPFYEPDQDDPFRFDESIEHAAELARAADEPEPYDLEWTPLVWRALMPIEPHWYLEMNDDETTNDDRTVE